MENELIGGIYQWRNKIDGKIYIGSAKNFEERRKRHLRQLRGNYHHSILFQRAFNKYGEDNFVFEILEYLEDDNDLRLKIEQEYLDKLQPFAPNGYNISKGATNCVLYGEQNGMWGKLGENNPNFGRKNSEETKQKISKGNKGKKRTPEMIKHMSEIKKGQESPFKGKHWDENNRKRLSDQNSVSVLQIDKDTNEIIREFKGAKEASDILKISASTIGAVCKHKKHYNTAGGFKWEYKDEKYRKKYIK